MARNIALSELRAIINESDRQCNDNREDKEINLMSFAIYGKQLDLFWYFMFLKPSLKLKSTCSLDSKKSKFSFTSSQGFASGFIK